MLASKDTENDLGIASVGVLVAGGTSVVCIVLGRVKEGVSVVSSCVVPMLVVFVRFGIFVVDCGDVVISSIAFVVAGGSIFLVVVRGLVFRVVFGVVLGGLTFGVVVKG